jgi:transketolase
MKGQLPADAFKALDAHIAEAARTKPGNATRVHSGAALDQLIPT